VRPARLLARVQTICSLGSLGGRDDAQTWLGMTDGSCDAAMSSMGESFSFE
jgi:hypothetical protein